MIDPNDDLSEILTPKPSQPLNELRERLLRQTESRLVRQRWARSAVRATLISSIFLLGGLSGWLIRPVPVPQVGELPQPEIVVVPVVVPVPTTTESGSAETKEITQKLSGSQAELQAEQEDDPATAAKLYKLAGDAFLREENYPNATRCYRLYLVQAGDAALSIGSDDSWLLTSLKNAVFQEKSRVSKTSS